MAGDPHLRDLIALKLPLSPLVSVTSVKYIDTAGVEPWPRMVSGSLGMHT